MSEQLLSEQERRAIFEQRIRPVIFPHPPTDSTPTMVFLSAQPGAGSSRAIGGLVGGGPIAALSASALLPFHPRYREFSQSKHPSAQRALAETTTEWMRAALQYSRTTHRSLLLDGTRSAPDIALATTNLFARAGFATTVAVVAISRAESLLATASDYLLSRRKGHARQLTTIAEHDASLLGTRVLVESLETTLAVDRLTVIGREGTPEFDTERNNASGFTGAAGALAREHAKPLSAAQSMRWLSELRAMTDYALSLPEVERPVSEALIELHEVALHEVLPRVPLPQDSRARPATEASLGFNLVALRRAAQLDRRPSPQPGPVVAPAPDRGISI